MKTISPTAAWGAEGISVPVAGERPAKSTHIETPCQALLNKAAYLKNYAETQVAGLGAADTALSGRLSTLEQHLLLTSVQVMHPITFLASRKAVAAIVDTIDSGTVAFRADTTLPSTLTYKGVNHGYTQHTEEFADLGANSGTVVCAANSGLFSGVPGTLACLSNVAGTYYLVSLTSNRLYDCSYHSRGSTTRPTTEEPASPQLIVDPVTATYWMRIGRYVLNGDLSVNQDCGCGAPVTSKPCMGVYNGTVVVGYYGGTAAQCDVRYKAGAGAWTQGGAIVHEQSAQSVAAISYDPARAVWTAILSNGYVLETSNLASAWIPVSYDTFPTTLYGSPLSIDKAWIFGTTIVVLARTASTYSALCVSFNSGTTWSVQILAGQDWAYNGTSRWTDAFFGGRHMYVVQRDDFDGATVVQAMYVSRLGIPPLPYAGDWP